MVMPENELTPFRMVKVVSFVFLLYLIFQSAAVNANSFYQDNPEFQINPGAADAPVPQNKKGALYRIQVKAEPAMTTDLKLLAKQCHQTNLVVEKHKGLFKYLSEPIANQHNAIQQLRLIHTYRGFENSFIVIYRNGLRINADGSQSEVQYVLNEKTDDLKKVSVHKLKGAKFVSVKKLVSRPLAVNAKISVAQAKTTKEKILRVVNLPFNQYKQCEVLLILTTLLLNFAMIALFLWMHHLYIKNRVRNLQKLKELYAESLAGFLLDKSIDPTIPVALLNVNTDFQKNLLIQEMMYVIQNIGNGAEERMKALYYKLELQHHSIHKLNSRNWILKVPAMHELAVFHVSEAADSVEKYIYHKNQIIKQEAIRCLVRLTPPDQLETFLNYQDKAVHKSVIQIIGELHLNQYCEPLMLLYSKENKSVQLIILDAMCKLGDTLLLNFLSDIVLKDNDMEIRLKAATALVNIGSLGLMRMQVLLLNQDKDIEAIYNQVTVKPV